MTTGEHHSKPTKQINTNKLLGDQPDRPVESRCLINFMSKNNKECAIPELVRESLGIRESIGTIPNGTMTPKGQ